MLRPKRIVQSAMLTIAALIGLTGCSACDDDADVVSDNISKAADNFEVFRRIVFYNTINGDYILVIEGKCNIEDDGNQLEVTCKLSDTDKRKHFLGLTNVTYFVEQTKPINVSDNNYRVSFNPETLIPDIQKE
jgi:hypothetical protein